MQRFSALLLTLMLLMSVLFPFTASAEDSLYVSDIKIYVNGVQVAKDTAPLVQNSRTLAPIREIAESCGISVLWNGDTREVSLSYGVTTASVTIDSPELRVYNSVIDLMSYQSLEASPIIVDSTTYITLRAVLEALGMTVEWDDESRSVYVTSPEAQKNNGASSSSDSETNTDSASDSITYTGFREMENHTIIESKPHGLYGKIRTDAPITLVRCRIADTDMDYTLRFKEADNLTVYNVFTYFDKLMCFSDAGIGEHTFEVYAAVNSGKAEKIFEYTYTVVSKNAGDSGNDENADSTGNPENSESTENPPSSENSEGTVTQPSEDTSEETESTENSGSTEDSEADKSDVINDIAISYYGFRKMTGDTIVVGAPHGLYGSVVSNHPITLVRCRLVGTDMDYTVEISPDDNVTSYNVFTYFDKLICFSDAGIGKQQFEIYAGAAGNEPQLLFSYNYTVKEKSEPSSEIGTQLYVPSANEVCLPLEGNIQVTSPYGFRAYNKWEFHKGVDIISGSLNIISVADGTVVDCATGRNSGVGNYVAIEHTGGWVSLYYHLASYDVEIGDKVKKGQKIAIMGNSGGNYGVHLHFMACDKWYGSLWATQNNHHKPPHEYIPQLLDKALYYTPCFESSNNDKLILGNFRFPTTMEKGTAFSISSSKPKIISENPIASITLTITDTDGNVLLSETTENLSSYTSDIYTYTNIDVNFDAQCEFDRLPEGKMQITISTVSSKGRERVVYLKDFTVTKSEKTEISPEIAVPEEIIPEEAIPEEAIPEETIPEEAVADNTTSDIKPEITADTESDIAVATETPSDEALQIQAEASTEEEASQEDAL